MAATGALHPTITLLQTSSLASVVQAELERMILSGELAPGEKLTEMALAARLGVSRGPLREAFRMLDEAGLVRTEKNRGVFVRDMPIDEAIEIFDLRAAMDELVGRRLAETITPAALREVRALVDSMEQAVKAKDAYNYHLLNLKFHDRLVELAGNGKLTAIYRKLIKELSLFRRLNLADGWLMPISAGEHRQIVKAIASGDADAAGKAMFDHVIESKERTIKNNLRQAGPMPTAFKSMRTVKANGQAAQGPESDMLHLLNLLAAIALLVWGTHIVRTGMLRVFGENLRRVLAKSFSNRLRALLAGLGVTSIVQSSTATCLIVASFVGKGLVTTSAALAVMLGADVGTSLMAVVFSFDLSWLSPLLIFVGVVVFISRQNSGAGAVGRVLIGLGLITLALQLIVAATRPLTESPAVRALLVALPNDVLLDIVVGAVLTVLSYSSLAIVLLIATLANSGMLPVGGARPGARRQPRQRRARDAGDRQRVAAGAAPAARQPDLQGGRRAAGHAAAAAGHVLLQQLVPTVPEQVVMFHLGFNVVLASVHRLHRPGRAHRRALAARAALEAGTARPRHLDPLAWPRRRWPSPAPRARRCTRPTWSRPCCAASCR